MKDFKSWNLLKNETCNIADVIADNFADITDIVEYSVDIWNIEVWIKLNKR